MVTDAGSLILTVLPSKRSNMITVVADLRMDIVLEEVSIAFEVD